MSIVSGIRSGIRSAIRSGLNPALSASMASVTQDATSLKYWPSTSGEWSTAASVASVSAPSKAWNCQDTVAQASLAAAVGSVTLASEGTRQTYQQAVAGWTRKGLKSSGDGWLSSDVSLPDASTTSSMKLGYALVVRSGTATTDIMALGAFATGGRARMDTTGHMAAVANGAAGSSGASVASAAVRPYVLQINRAASLVKVYTDQEVVTVALGAVTGKGIYVGGGLAGDDATFLGLAEWEGAAAEMTQAQVKTLLQTLNWTIPWS